MLGIPCAAEHSWRSKPMTSDIPISLRPTKLQQTRMHHIWVDLFPFPRMRKNMISLSSAFTEEEFLEDLLKQPSFYIEARRPARILPHRKWQGNYGEIGISILVAEVQRSRFRSNANAGTCQSRMKLYLNYPRLWPQRAREAALILFLVRPSLKPG
jgi:hypothetical protein